MQFLSFAKNTLKRVVKYPKVGIHNGLVYLTPGNLFSQYSSTCIVLIILLLKASQHSIQIRFFNRAAMSTKSLFLALASIAANFIAEISSKEEI